MSDAPPRWIGSGFQTGTTISRVLVYDEESSNWSDALTAMHEAEAGRDHPIDIASRLLAVWAVIAATRTIAEPLILDVGCSSGFILDELRRALPAASLIGTDYLRGPLERLAKRMSNIPIVQFDLRRCPLPDNTIDAITCLNVLEHIDDHEAAISHLYRVLKPGGIAHIEVPAGPHLYDIYDEQLMHHRRYRMRDLCRMATDTGFSVVRATHLGFSVYPAFCWVKLRNRRLLTAHAARKASAVVAAIRETNANPIFSLLIRAEVHLGRTFRYPWGIRCVATLRKC